MLAGGRLSVADTDMPAVRRVPLTAEPYLDLRHRGDHFEATVIGEVDELFEDVGVLFHEVDCDVDHAALHRSDDEPGLVAAQYRG